MIDGLLAGQRTLSSGGHMGRRQTLPQFLPEDAGRGGGGAGRRLRVRKKRTEPRSSAEQIVRAMEKRSTRLVAKNALLEERLRDLRSACAQEEKRLAELHAAIAAAEDGMAVHLTRAGQGEEKRVPQTMVATHAISGTSSSQQ